MVYKWYSAGRRVLREWMVDLKGGGKTEYIEFDFGEKEHGVNRERNVHNEV